jgi:hypothetical protein
MSYKDMTKEGPNLIYSQDNSKVAGDFISPTYESWLPFFEGRFVPPETNGVMAWFLYTFGYSSFISGNKESLLLALKILKTINNNLAELLEYRISQPSSQMSEEIGTTLAHENDQF